MAAPHISRFTLEFFRVIVRMWFALHFESVLAFDTEPFREHAESSPLIVYGNHSSWWDPMIAVLLAEKLMPGRNHYAPMDESSLAQNAILSRIGIFGVDIHSARGAKQFHQRSLAVLSDGGVLWITPQGRFADVRERPLGFKPGLASISARWPAGCTLIPLATEYTFWNNRRPNALAHFGKAIQVEGNEDKSSLNLRLEIALEEAMSELRAMSLTRDASSFTRLPLWRSTLRAPRG